MSTIVKSRNESYLGDITFHPCYHEEAHRKYARMHLPVAPKCNIQCRFCNRKFDCFNETRPGVTSRLLRPKEAVTLIEKVIKRLPTLSVVGIAGPGEPLANKETFETLKRVNVEYPDLTLCLATNGLLLPKYADEISELGVNFITVTVNALDMHVGSRIYSWVQCDDSTLSNQKAFEILTINQWDGIEKSIENDMVVKVNSVLIPGINDDELPRIAEKAGVFVMNVIPFLPVKGSEFENRRAPTRMETLRCREECKRHIRQISHCSRCRADAIGFLGRDITRDFY